MYKSYKISERRIKGEARGGRGRPCRLLIHKKSQYMRRWLVRNPWVRPFVVFSFSATRIQALARGFLVRKEGGLRTYVQKRNAAWEYKMKLSASRRGKDNTNTSDRSRSHSHNHSPQIVQKELQLDKYLAYVNQFETQGVMGLSRRPVDMIPKVQHNDHIGTYPTTAPFWLQGGYSVWCIVRIQAWYKACVVRRRYLYKKRVVMQIGALVIQNAWRAVCVNRIQWIKMNTRKRILMQSPVKASTRIQLAWRAYCNRRIFSYYRDLVMVKLQGAPAEILKVIIPNESSLLDKAAGVACRFRLGGHIFPPKVFFKLFTYRGVCDVNAFAPRDYANEKPVEAFQQNIQSHFIPKDAMKYNRNIRVGATYFDTKVMTATSMDNWYKREERNSWRPLVPTNQHDDILTPPWMREVLADKPLAPFHFSKLKRRTDHVRLRKKKKREWLRKAYMLAGVDLNGLRSGTGGAVAGEVECELSDIGMGTHEGERESKSKHRPNVTIVAGPDNSKTRAGAYMPETFICSGDAPVDSPTTVLDEFGNPVNVLAQNQYTGKSKQGHSKAKGGYGAGELPYLNDGGQRTYSADMNTRNPRNLSRASNSNGTGTGNDASRNKGPSKSALDMGPSIAGEDGFGQYDLDDGTLSESLAYLSMSQSALDNGLPGISNPNITGYGNGNSNFNGNGNGNDNGNGNGNGNGNDVTDYCVGAIRLPMLRTAQPQQPMTYQQQLQSYKMNNGNDNGNVNGNGNGNGNYRDGRRGGGNTNGNGTLNETDLNDDLLAWSMALDFDDYASNWGNIATSRVV